MNKKLTMLGAPSSSSQPFTNQEIMMIEARSVLSPYPFMQFQSKNILQLRDSHWNNSTECPRIIGKKQISQYQMKCFLQQNRPFCL